MTPPSATCSRINLTRTTRAVLAKLLANPQRELYGLQISIGTDIDSGTLYPILRRLEARGWATSRWEDLSPEEEGRPRRRYYRLTPDGATQARALLTRPKKRRGRRLTEASGG